MRILAYILLILGFVWVCFCHLQIRPVARGVTVAHYEKIPKQESYKLEDVQKGMRDVASDMASHIPSFYVGALLMLGGGILLDVTGRRKRVTHDAA